jgi:hypothetical protein
MRPGFSSSSCLMLISWKDRGSEAANPQIRSLILQQVSTLVLYETETAGEGKG